MTSTVPPAVAWPLILFMVLVVVTCYVGFNTNLFEPISTTRWRCC